MEGFAYSLPSPSHAIRWRLRRWRNGIGRRNGRNGKSIEHGNNTPTSADQKYGASLAQRLPGGAAEGLSAAFDGATLWLASTQPVGQDHGKRRSTGL